MSDRVPVPRSETGDYTREWATRRRDFVKDCTAVTAPTLVLTGEKGLDRVVPVESTREYLRLIPGSIGAELPRTGHIGCVTRADEWAARVWEFVDGVTAPAAVAAARG